MIDPDRSFGSKNQEKNGLGNRSPVAAAAKGAKTQPSTGHVDITAMVRSLQRVAGVTDCFRMGNADCDLVDCDWRTFCLGFPSAPKPETEAD